MCAGSAFLLSFTKGSATSSLNKASSPKPSTRYQDDREIRQRLVESDPSNSRADWQFYLSQSYAKLGSAYAAQKDNAKAREAYETGRAIIARQVALLPDNVKGKSLLHSFDVKLAALKP